MSPNEQSYFQNYFHQPINSCSKDHFDSSQFEKVRQDGKKKLKFSAVPFTSAPPVSAVPARIPFTDITFCQIPVSVDMLECHLQVMSAGLTIGVIIFRIKSQLCQRGKLVLNWMLLMHYWHSLNNHPFLKL